MQWISLSITFTLSKFTACALEIKYVGPARNEDVLYPKRERQYKINQEKNPNSSERGIDEEYA